MTMPSTLELGVDSDLWACPVDTLVKPPGICGGQQLVFAPYSAGTASGGRGSQGNTVSLIIGQSCVIEKCMNNEW